MTFNLGDGAGTSGSTATITYSPNSWGDITVTTDGSADSEISNTVKRTKKRIGPRLYFRYVKSKFKKTEEKILFERLGKIQELLLQAEELNQYALHEELSKRLLEDVFESEAMALGIDTWVEEKHIHKFMGFVKASDSDDDYRNKIVYFKSLEEFPRPIPVGVRKKIKKVQDREIFDELMVLYLDYTNDSKEIKSTKEKIREKDPIIFGRKKDGERLYYIVDWVDDVCDLTLDKIIESKKVKAKKIPEINKRYLTKLKNDIIKKQKRLEETKSSNYKELIQKEENERKKGKDSFWKKLKRKFGG